MAPDYWMAATIGFFSTWHCLAMCGAIVGALSLGLPPEVRDKPARMTAFVLAYNVGRIGSYMLAGALIGAIGAGADALFMQSTGVQVLRILALVVLLATGLYVAGWFPQFTKLERIGQPVWNRMQPWATKLMPVRTPGRALVYGVVWGWLPCGLVYSMLVVTLGMGSALKGALFMLAFGLGTLPVVAISGSMTGFLARVRQWPWLGNVAGVTIIAMAVWGIWEMSGFQLGSEPHCVGPLCTSTNGNAS